MKDTFICSCCVEPWLYKCECGDEYEETDCLELEHDKNVVLVLYENDEHRGTLEVTFSPTMKEFSIPLGYNQVINNDSVGIWDVVEEEYLDFAPNTRVTVFNYCSTCWKLLTGTLDHVCNKKLYNICDQHDLQLQGKNKKEICDLIREEFAPN